MEALKKYKIDIADLSLGEREYQFEFNDELFNNFENSIAEKGCGIIKIVLNKTESFIELSLHISGIIELSCDRSLDLFDFPIDTRQEVIIKFGDEPDLVEDEEDILFITWNTPSINVAQLIYEYISMEIPMKRLHPRFQENDDKNDELIYSSEVNSEEEIEADPRWNKLKELKKEK